ncbi:MAG: PAS domain-containing sensor histidine kinase [Rhodobacteraceae bacterium]|nr:PAS domain-containing sensor histidine kinase [Paracoccaceae bacterium]
MVSLNRNKSLSKWLSNYSNLKPFQSVINLFLVLLGPLLAVATYLFLGPFNVAGQSVWLRFLLLLDLIYVLLIVGIVLVKILYVLSQRRSRLAGSKLHFRLAGVFTTMSLLPTITVAIFATVSINLGLEAWFSERVQSVIGTSLSAARAYAGEQRAALIEDLISVEENLQNFRKNQYFIEDDELRNELASHQLALQRGLKEAFILNGDGNIELRGERSYLFGFEKPTQQQIQEAIRDIVLISDFNNNELRALTFLNGFGDRYLYVTRQVDGTLFNLLDETQKTAVLYQQMESDRTAYLLNFAVLYFALALLLIVSSVLFALWFAERLSKPIGRLAAAAKRVGAGELTTQVIEDDGDDEIAQLGRYFNQMTKQLKHQRDTLVDSTEQIEERRRLFDSVLSSVTSGVIVLNPEGQVSFTNNSANVLLKHHNTKENQNQLSDVFPELNSVFHELKVSRVNNLQCEIKLVRSGRLENFLVRMAPMDEDKELKGYVVAFDDITSLVSAQRSAAWGDVARRIAHEIKNPLTPIQLSAERIRKKFSPLLGDNAEKLRDMVDVITRQTDDLRRIVDEFSKFARMPELRRENEDLNALVSSTVSFQQAGQPNVLINLSQPNYPLIISIDPTLINQALTNILKNAGEAIETRMQSAPTSDQDGVINVLVEDRPESVVINISDNGVGLPEDRSRLFEPYVTTRDKGTGLGLAIVKKIIEEHGGILKLEDSVPCENTGIIGALISVELPKSKNL